MIFIWCLEFLIFFGWDFGVVVVEIVLVGIMFVILLDGRFIVFGGYLIRSSKVRIVFNICSFDVELCLFVIIVVCRGFWWYFSI